MRPELAVYIAIGVARALHVAHELRDESGRPLSVVHRDVSPQNVLLSHQGEVKLIDFGVAKASHRKWATIEGSLKGKLGYMSPEQARAAPIDRRTDVYALGVVLWENLTHRRLFTGEAQALLERVQNPNVARPSTLVPGISQHLDAAVMRALAPHPDHRFATARELEVALIACPEAASVDVDALSALVLSAMHERPEDSTEKSVRDTLEIPRPSIDRRTGALAAVTMEVAMLSSLDRGSLAPPSTAPSLPPSAFSPSAFSPAPPTRVTQRPPSVPLSPWPRRIAIGLVALLAVVGSAALVWIALSVLHPQTVASPSAPAPPVAPAALGRTPMSPSIAPPAPPPPPAEELALPELEPEPEPDLRRGDRHRGHRDRHHGVSDDFASASEAPYGTLPPPYAEGSEAGAGSTARSSTSRTNEAAGGAPALPPSGPPMNGGRRAPVRIDPQDVPPPVWP